MKIKTTLKTLLLALTLLISPGLLADNSDSVGALYRRTSSNSLDFNCTVTAIERKGNDLILLTAAHCVSEDPRTLYLVTFEGLTFYNATLYRIPRELPDDPQEVDIAELAIKDYKGEVKLTKAASTSEKVARGSDIETVGFPLGAAKLLYKGYVAGRHSSGMLILQIFGAPGSSGTSVVEKKSGQIIGVLVAASGNSVGTPVIYATPVEYRRYLVTPVEKRKIKKD